VTFDSFGFWRESWTLKVRDAHPPLVAAFEAFAAQHDLELSDLEALETRTVRKPGLLDRLFGRDTTSRSLAAVMPGLVVWAVLPEKATEAKATAAHLATVTVDRGMAGRIAAAFPTASQMRGLSFTGVYVGRTGAAATTFLGYGREVDGDAFERHLREAMRDAGNPLHGLID
jgi:hypothetical protein